MPYWLNETLAATPALIWMFVGVGLPYALIALPRDDWRDWPTVACLTVAFGPGLVTAYMFVLGSVQNAGLLRLDMVIVGMVVIALVGWGLVWRNYKLPSRSEASHRRQENLRAPMGLKWDEKLLLGLIGVALVVRWIGVAYWPFTAYDALWVYGYEGRLYTLLGYIPNTIGYYPQFLPLQFTYLQLAVGGVNDHAARAVLPWLHVGAILATYVLGRKLFNRRVGIIAAAIWTLYPHVGEWSRFGDLEIPVAFLFTAAAAFFLKAWINTHEPPKHPEMRRYAIIAGLLLGIGMWTKPTMGAFIWGVMLVVGVWLVISYGLLVVGKRDGAAQKRGEWLHQVKPSIAVVMWTGIASIPLGAAWYVRNVMNGHPAIDLPPGYWQSLAARSGVELGWLLLVGAVLVVWVLRFQFSVFSSQSGQNKSSLNIKGLLVGVGLVVAGVLPSIYNSGRIGITDNRMGALEWLALAAGVVILWRTLWVYAWGRWTDEGRANAAKIGWALALALPYFVTWFYSYSYHYRLSFAIVPLLILPTAVMLAVLSSQFSVPSSFSKVIAVVVIVGVGLPGIAAPLYDPNAGNDWLWTDKLPDDHAKYASGNPALMALVDGLQAYVEQHPDGRLRVFAPDVKRLPFFFPLDDIRTDGMPSRLSELDGMTYFVYGVPESGGDFGTFTPGSNQVLDALSLAATDPNDTSSAIRRAWDYDDGIFKYTVYELRLQNRFVPPFVNVPTEGEVVFGDFVRFMGYDIGTSLFWPGRKVVMHLYWEVLETPSVDYTVYIHLRDSGGTVLQAWDGRVTRTEDGNYYSTLVWEPGEYISDERIMVVNELDAAEDQIYQIVIGLYDPITQARVPISIDGLSAGDGYALAERVQYQAKAPE